MAAPGNTHFNFAIWNNRKDVHSLERTVAGLKTDLQAAQTSIRALLIEAAHSAAMFTQFTRALRDNRDAGRYEHITIADDGAATERLQGWVAGLEAAVARLGSSDAGGQVTRLVEALAAQEGHDVQELVQRLRAVADMAGAAYREHPAPRRVQLALALQRYLVPL